MSGDLKKIREDQNKLMPETVYVQRLTRVDDGSGGWGEVWNSIATVKGRIASSQGREEELGKKVMALTTYTVTLPYDTSINQTDRLQINGQQYQVLAILNRSEKTALRVLCEKIE
jgi:SPP1 family predicted phage head-tail adaptor